MKLVIRVRCTINATQRYAKRTTDAYDDAPVRRAEAIKIYSENPAATHEVSCMRMPPIKPKQPFDQQYVEHDII
jgi:hypothetical protein